MLDTRLSSYLNGILDLASALSEWIGYSNAGVSAYTKDGWEEAFRRHYHIKSFTPVPVGETMYQTLVQWLGSTSFGLVKNVTDCITHKLGEPLAVYRAENEQALIELQRTHRRVLFHRGRVLRRLRDPRPRISYGQLGVKGQIRHANYGV